MFTHTISNYSRRLAGFTSVVVLLCFTSQCAADRTEFVARIRAAKVCYECSGSGSTSGRPCPTCYANLEAHCTKCFEWLPLDQSDAKQCPDCDYTGHKGKDWKSFSRQRSKTTGNGQCHPCTAEISVVRDDELGNVYKYFLFKTNIEEQKFRVAKVGETKGDWLRLKLRSPKITGKFRDRWVEINKSVDFLSYLLRDSAMEDMTGASKKAIEEALKCEECDGDGNVSCDGWLSFFTKECTACGGEGDFINLTLAQIKRKNELYHIKPLQ